MMHNHISYIYNGVISTLETESDFARRFLNSERWLKQNTSVYTVSVENARAVLWQIVFRLITEEKDLLAQMSSEAARNDPAQAGIIGVFIDDFNEKLKEMQRFASDNSITLE